MQAGHVRPRHSSIVRLFDYTLFLIVLCVLPACRRLLVFLTYPLGLGFWLAFTDTEIGRGRRMGLARQFSIAPPSPGRPQHGLVDNLLHGRRDGRKIRPRFVARLLLNENLPFKSLLRAIILLPLIVADSAFGDRRLVHLRSAVLDHFPPAGGRAALATPISTFSERGGTHDGR